MGQEADEGSTSTDIPNKTSTQIVLKRVMMNGTADNWMNLCTGCNNYYFPILKSVFAYTHRFCMHQIVKTFVED